MNEQDRASTGPDKPGGARCGRAFLLLLPLAVAAVWLVQVAWQLQIEYWDGYYYLLNARHLARQSLAHVGIAYDPIRAPLLTLLVWPIVELFHRPQDPGLGVTAIHLWMLALSVLSLAAAYRLWWQELGRSAALGVVVLGLNPLFLHYAPFTLADILSMLVVSLALAAYLRAESNPSGLNCVWLALALAAAISAKYPCLLLFPVFALHRLWSFKDRLSTHLRLVAAGLGGLATAYLLHLVIAEWLGRPLSPIEDFRASMAAAGPAFPTDRRSEYLGYLWAILTPVGILLGLYGAALAVRRRTPSGLLHLLWTGLFLMAMSLGLRHKEARYLFPVLPSVIYFVLLTVDEGRRRLPQRAFAVGMAVVSIWPAALAYRALAEFDDPLYRSTFPVDLAKAIHSGTAPTDAIALEGDEYYSLYPAAPVRYEMDEFYAFHHFGRPAIAYLADRGVQTGANPKAKLTLRPGHGYYDTGTAATRPEPPLPYLLDAQGAKRELSFR